MNIEQYECLVDKCTISLDENNLVHFKPLSYKAGKAVEKVIKDNQLENLTLQNFQAINEECRPLYLARRKVKARKFDQFAQMTTQQVADLPLEKKLEYMEILFPLNQNIDELKAVCAENKENIKACLFNIDFSQSFWEKEKKSAERYASLITAQPEITNKLKNWQETSLDDKKEVIKQAGIIFEYVYGIAPQVEYFTPEEARAKNAQQGLSADAHIEAAYQKGGKIYFNEERLQTSDNLFAIAVLFHEGTHLRQHFQTFEDDTVERIFNCNLVNAATYENIQSDKESADYMDLYAMQPSEKHAHGLHEFVEQQIMEKTGMEKVSHTELSKETKQIHNKAFSMAKVTQYRSKQKIN